MTTRPAGEESFSKLSTASSSLHQNTWSPQELEAVRGASPSSLIVLKGPNAAPLPIPHKHRESDGSRLQPSFGRSAVAALPEDPYCLHLARVKTRKSYCARDRYAKAFAEDHLHTLI